MSGNYSYNITVPANTTFNNRKKEPITLSSGIINKILIVFPSGCAGLVKVQILEKEHVLFPANPDSYYSGNNTTIEFDTFYEINKANTLFNIVLWNEDTVFQHTIFIMINIVPVGSTIGGAFGVIGRLF